MNKLCLFGMANICLSITGLVTTTNSSAAIIENPDNGHFYELILEDVTWDQANDAANARPGNWHLVTITDAVENAFIQSLLTPGTPIFDATCPTSSLVGQVCTGFWLGATSSSNTSNDWSWVTGETWSFTNWAPFEPFSNGDRLRIDEFRDQGPLVAWNDVPGDRLSNGYIVESSVVPVPAAAWLFTSGFIGLFGMARFKSV